MTHLFVIDDFTSLNPERDTSLALMVAAKKLGYQVLACGMEGLNWRSSRAVAIAALVEENEGHLALGEKRVEQELSGEELVVWMRKDPPVDRRYQAACHLLEASCVKIINRPSSLLSVDEKLLALRFPKYTPKTWVSSEIRFLKDLVESERELILKPIGNFSGRGVLRLRTGDSNIPGILEMSTNFGREAVIVQEYLPAVRVGDKRVLVFNGETLGAMNRVPHANDHRGARLAGATLEAATISGLEAECIRAVVPTLQQLGLWFVGLDFVGERLTEINFTSPSGILEIGRFVNLPLASTVIEGAGRLIKY